MKSKHHQQSGTTRFRNHTDWPIERLEKRALLTVPAFISIGDASLVEGDSGTSFLLFPVTRSGDTSSAVSVSYSTSNNTAIAGSDYTATTNVVTFAAGVTTATISIPISGDVLIEGNESFFVNLLGISDSIGTGPAASFASKQDFSTTDTAARAISVGDLNGDGKPDVAVAISSFDKVSVFFNTTVTGSSTMTFAAKTDFATGDAPVFVRIGDLNGDGKPDLTTGNFSGTSVSVLLNTTPTGGTTATFAAKQDFTTQANPYYLSIADINGDGRPDLAVANQGSRSVSVLLNQTVPGAAVPSFSSKFDFTAGFNPDSVTLGDFNGDGKPDFAVSNNYASSISVLLNTTATGSTTPTFTPHQEFTSFNRTFSTEIADLNADGKVDLAVVNRDAGTVSVLINTTPLGASNFSFGSRQDYAVDGSARSVAIQDLNGDGRVDLAVTNNGSSSISVLLNQTVPGAATSSFSLKQDFTTGQGPIYIQIADMNGDSKPDLVSNNAISTSFSVLLNTLASPSTIVALADSQDVTSGDAASSVALGDFNGDGKLDMVVPNVGSSAVSVLLNTGIPGSGASAFSAAQDFGTDSGPFSVAVGDFNKDGRPDLVVTNETTDKISVLLNTTVAGSPTVSFTTAQLFSTGSGPRSVAVGDINGDGLSEIVVGNALTNTVSVFYNTTSPGSSTPTFDAKQDFLTGTNPRFVSLGDFNGDGKIDLATANSGSNTVSVLLNTTAPASGTFGFTTNQEFNVGQLPKSVSIADVNGDGKPDLAASSFTNNLVSVLVNTTAPGAGSPSFAPRQDFSLGAGASSYSASFGDFNGDGKPDLAVANSGSNTVSLLVNTTVAGSGLPTFAAKQDFAAGQSPGGIVVGDLNADGKPDLVLANRGAASVSVALRSSAVISDSQAIGTIQTDDFVPSAILDLNGSNGAGTGFTATFIENFAAVNIADADATITDVGFSTLVNLKLVISANPDGANELLSVAGVSVPLHANLTDMGIVGATTFQVDYVALTRTLTVTKSGGGTAPIADFQSLLRQITYTNNSNTPNTTARTISITAFDSSADSPAVIATISVTSTNDAPTDMALAPTSIAESQTSGSSVGTLISTDPDTGDTFTYTLVTGVGSSDNASFTILNGVLKTSTGLDFETKPSYDIRVRTTDQGGLTFEKQFTITVTNTNEAPTDMGLTSTSIAENLSSGSLVGLLSTIDQDAGDTLTYSFATGIGSADNGSFSLVNGQLTTAASFDFETKSSYSIRLRTTDQGGLSFDRQFTISIVNANEIPTDVNLSATTIPENSDIGTTVGTLSSTDPDAGNIFTYTLATGIGSTDNGSFTISNGQLRTATNLDFETTSSYAIRIRTTDQDGQFFEKSFTIAVTNLNEAPSDMGLTAAIVTENLPSGTVVGSLSSTDQDAGNTFSYSFATGTGSADNGNFTIVNGQLRTALSFDFETKNSHAIRIRSTDQGGMSFEKQFTISVVNANESPNDIALNPGSIAENSATGTSVGTLTAADPDLGNSFTFTLIAGAGSTDNSSFTISNGQLLTAASLDFETKTSYSIRVLATDQGGLTVEKSFTVSVSNLNEVPTDIALSASSIAENEASVSTIGTFSSTDPDNGNTSTYSFVTGTGSADNGAFTILGNVLKTNSSFNFELKNSYSIRIRTTDQGGQIFEKAFTISVTDRNEPTTDIALTTTSLDENSPLGTVIGAFSSIDPDLTNTFTYTLVAGLGSLDNSSFAIVNGQLQTAAIFNFESKSAYSIRVRSTDQTGTPFEKNFTIAVININEAPVDFVLSPLTISENRPVGTTVGTFTATDSDAGESFTYALVSGGGSNDNDSFNILNGQLQTGAVFNFEAKSSYVVRVRVTDLGGLSIEKQFTITITNINEAPSDITITNLTVAENQPSGTVVGSFSSSDADVGGTFTYSLVAGSGSTDNTSFTISNGQLLTAASFNFEVKNSYSIRVRTTDQGGLSFEKSLSIAISAANDAPTDMELTNSSLTENQSSGTDVGVFSSSDPDTANTFTYSLVGGSGSTDNSRFSILNGQLKTAASFDFETNSSYSIRVRSTDQGGLFVEKSFAITVTDVNEAPTDSSLVTNSIAENSPIGTTIGIFTSTDADAANTFTYSLATGSGDTDNASFQIVNGELKNSASFDFETKNTYSIRVRSTDQGGLSFEKQFTIAVTNVNEAPTVSSIAAQSIPEDSNTGILNFVIGDPESLAPALIVSATSSNLTLIPNGNLTLTGTGPDRGISVLPLANQSGTTTITIFVSDGTNTSSTTFPVTVSAVNDAPTLTGFLAQTIQEDIPTGALLFTVADVDHPVNDLVVSAVAENTTLIPNGNMTFSGTGANRSLVITPATNQSGTSMITVTITDGVTSSNQTFQITVLPVDDAPAITVTAQPLIYRVSSRAIVPIDSTATLLDVDTPTLQFGGAVLRVSGHTAKDTLSILKQNGIVRKGKNILSGTTAIGTLAGGKKGIPLTVNLNGAATQSSVQMLLKSIGFKSTNKVPGNRSIQIQITNIGGKNSNTAQREIQVGL